MEQRLLRSFSVIAACAAIGACGSDSPTGVTWTPKDPATAMHASIDRFGATAALFVRNATNGLPAANAAIDMDTGPFITVGFGPHGEHIKYYNFDVQPTAPAPIYVLYRQGESSPVAGQMNIIDVIPGQPNYNDFWQITKVTVPSNYVANAITSVDEIRAGGYHLEATTTIVNCPVVPEGSVARLRFAGGASPLTHGWYRGQVVAYFNFDEATITTTSTGTVPVVPIWVTFNVNPNQTGGGPASGFKTETGSLQTHNVASVLPTTPGYSPLWSVIPFNNSAFATVHDATTATAAPLFTAAGNVNCPIVAVSP